MLDARSIAPITVAAPVMSCFISSMRIDGLIEIPPRSKVTPLPTNAMVFEAPARDAAPALGSFGGLGIVLEDDNAPFALRALPHREDRAPFFRAWRPPPSARDSRGHAHGRSDGLGGIELRRTVIRGSLDQSRVTFTASPTA